MLDLSSAAVPTLAPELDPGFRPASLWNRAFRRAVQESGRAVPFALAVERDGGQVSVYKTQLFPHGEKKEWDDANWLYVERLVKCLLWVKGGWRVMVGGCAPVGERLKGVYGPGGQRAFDAEFMGRVYERPFEVAVVDYSELPEPWEKREKVGGHITGCRIGFDAGGSDRKVAALIDGEVVFTDETVWHPKLAEDPDYHFSGIMDSVTRAAAHLPRVDALGVSSAGIYINNRTMVASLFLKVPPELFEAKVKDIYLRVARELGDVPLVVCNDGDVTALAGAAALKENRVLGIAMGTSEAAGFVDASGSLTGWLNELAFVPVDFNPQAMVDEWSGDYGCGVKYFSQDAVIKLAPAAGIPLDPALSPAEKLSAVQDLVAQGHAGARKIFESIGRYLGYAVAHYADFYDLKHVLILGRVTSGQGGLLIQGKAKEVLRAEFPELAHVRFHLPEESERRVGQAITAAGLVALD